MGQAAAVIDLEEFRRRQATRETAKGMSPPPRRSPPVVPFWVVWIPVWPVA